MAAGIALVLRYTGVKRPTQIYSIPFATCHVGFC